MKKYYSAQCGKLQKFTLHIVEITVISSQMYIRRYIHCMCVYIQKFRKTNSFTKAKKLLKKWFDEIFYRFPPHQFTTLQKYREINTFWSYACCFQVFHIIMYVCTCMNITEHFGKFTITAMQIFFSSNQFIVVLN